ncbi:hypothetical protein BUALT_Bualt02G0095200 [Buddleja alternifolia]|uniref:HAT C-terminal dimerisation domain-containing protein n=1 Tax=Buddleja alternifolia TaxID=168488 RepID=A0AAV6Y0F2_9LAMI|nr:hypothetical protein BUALT_Bualt02G0095200 [Buddleja alternifolia]
MDYVDPSINEEVDDIENTDTIATDDDVQKPKRATTSEVWKHFEQSKDQDNLIQLFYKHCKHVFQKPSTGSTSHLGRHLKLCPVKLRADTLENRDSLTQSHISFLTRSVDPLFVPAFDGKFDMEKVKVEVAKWIMIHEYTFFAVEDEWCCAHILNLVAQDGLSEIKNVIERLNLRERKLIDNCRTRWNSTYEMLAIAIKFRDVFPRKANRDPLYLDCPSPSDWEKVVKGKVELDTVLDPRYKMMALEFFFPKLYSPENTMTELAFVRRTLYDLYSEHVSMCSAKSNASGEGSTSCKSSVDAKNVETGTLLSELASFLKEKQSVQPQKSELDMYLEENCFIEMENSKEGTRFDVLDWWKIHTLKNKGLSTMARDNLAIPITIVASESTFSVGSRVIDKYRSKLFPDSVELLMCGSDWLRKRHGQKKPVPIILPIDDDASRGRFFRSNSW